LNAGLPGEPRRLVVAPGLDHDVVARLKHEAFAGTEHMVVEVAAAGQPDATFEHGEFAGRALHAQRLPEDAFDGAAGTGIKLRIHHQSPIFVRCPDSGSAGLNDGAFGVFDPMRSALPINADLL
jgi:hypothetical protein